MEKIFFENCLISIDLGLMTLIDVIGKGKNKIFGECAEKLMKEKKNFDI